MANKRMFNIKIVDSDAFLDMPLSAQCLYFHLNMRADDDGFVGNPKRIQRLVGASEDDLKLLIAKRFLLTFENGVIVIKHWRMHNTLSMNRYSETVYTDEKKLLKIKENNSYSFDKGVPFDDTKYVEMSKRQSRRTKDEQKTNADIDLDIDLDIDKDIDKEKKENKKKKETLSSVINEYTDNEELRECLKEFVEMRKAGQKGMFTVSALKRNLTKLDTLAVNDGAKIDIVNQTIEYTYKGFYPLKETKKNNQKGGMVF